MNHDKYKVSLGIAKRLKDVGYPQESEWYFVGDPTVIVHCSKLHEYKQCKDGNLIWARPDVGELGEMLLWQIRADNKFLYLKCRYDKALTRLNWFYWYEHPYDKPHISFEANTEADSRGKVYIYLAENGYLKKQEEYL